MKKVHEDQEGVHKVIEERKERLKVRASHLVTR
jgi:hypothetical protein